MAVFQNRKYPSAAHGNTFGARYRAMMAKHPFLLFGLPFMSVIVAASFVLTPATAVRYEKYDRKVRQMTREEELGVGKSGRKVDIREEYYVSCPVPWVLSAGEFLQSSGGESMNGWMVGGWSDVCVVGWIVWLTHRGLTFATETGGQGPR